MFFNSFFQYLHMATMVDVWLGFVNKKVKNVVMIKKKKNCLFRDTNSGLPHASHMCYMNIHHPNVLCHPTTSEGWGVYSCYEPTLAHAFSPRRHLWCCSWSLTRKVTEVSVWSKKEDSLREKVKPYIFSHLDTPGLSPHEVAMICGLSVPESYRNCRLQQQATLLPALTLNICS